MSDKPHKKIIDDLLASKRKHEEGLDAEKLIEGILEGNKSALSESITLIESTKSEHQKIGGEILSACISNSENSIRIGITGVPGVGKSTFIESFGSYLTSIGKKVAVLAIDPSSERSGGSILGDKTRMSKLSIDENAFIRPSATRGSLGGVARRTRESILLCEAAGFDVILVETVGVGQSETAVHSMTDFFLLLMLAGAGDELQGIKRGIMEMADAILITKADGKNIKPANMARSQYSSALHLFPPTDYGWTPKVETVSAIENRGMEKTWEIIKDFEETIKSNNYFHQKRDDQQIYWMNETIKEKVLDNFYRTEGMAELIDQMKMLIKNSEITSYQAAERLMEFYLGRKK